MSTLLPSSLRWLHPLGSERAALSLSFLSLQLWSLISTPFTFSLKITFFSHYQADRFVLLRSLVPLFCPRFGPSVKKVVIPLVRGAELLSVRRLWSGRVMAKQSVLICRCHPFFWKPAKDVVWMSLQLLSSRAHSTNTQVLPVLVCSLSGLARMSWVQIIDM